MLGGGQKYGEGELEFFGWGRTGLDGGQPLDRGRVPPPVLDSSVNHRILGRLRKGRRNSQTGPLKGRNLQTGPYLMDTLNIQLSEYVSSVLEYWGLASFQIFLVEMKFKFVRNANVSCDVSYIREMH